jgi:hypothetical protein
MEPTRRISRSKDIIRQYCELLLFIQIEGEALKGILQTEVAMNPKLKVFLSSAQFEDEFKTETPIERKSVMRKTHALISVLLFAGLGVNLNGQANQPTVEELVIKATQGDIDAARQAGIRYADGKGVAQDSAAALYWLVTAGNGGDRFAHCELAERRATGRGVPVDLSDADLDGIAASDRNDLLLAVDVESFREILLDAPGNPLDGVYSLSFEMSATLYLESRKTMIWGGRQMLERRYDISAKEPVISRGAALVLLRDRMVLAQMAECIGALLGQLPTAAK